MKKTEEIVDRQNSQDKAGKNEGGGTGLKVEIDLNQNIVDAVNNWISESRETRRTEKLFSDERISAWKLVSLS